MAECSVDPASFLFLTLDSCRYDVFATTDCPNLKAVGPLQRAMAPGNFTYSSHAAMFLGFTPGVPGVHEPFINPKYGRIFKMARAGYGSTGREFVRLEGTSIMKGLRKCGYRTIGTGAVGWFDTTSLTGTLLTSHFQRFYYPGRNHGAELQVPWLLKHLARCRGKRVFAFMNVGETHVPYYYEGAPWTPDTNPCIPFAQTNDAEESRRRQTACLEYLDRALAPVLEAFDGANIIVCADHGDCWGEDGLWEHGIHHEKVFEVPLLLRLVNAP
jgi:hypothetical protein